MKANDLLDLIGNADDNLITEAKVQKKTKKNAWVKWCAMAACLCLVAVGAIGLYNSSNDSADQISVGGVMRKYKNVSVGGSEESIQWPWEYKTVAERFPAISFEGKEYSIKSTVNEAFVGDKIGAYEAVGYDDYTEQEYRQTFDVWQINGISADLMIAVEMEGQFYASQYNEYIPPETLGEVLDNYNLPQNLVLSSFGDYKDGKETGYYSIPDDDYIWQTLDGCRDARFVEDEAGGQISRDRITFTATSEPLGVYKRAFYVSADGYVSTNIFNWAYTFYIGEEAATDIITYAKKNSVETEQEPYYYSLAGTLTEIGDGYILVDDSILCADENDGMVFKVMTSDIRISRCIDFQKISTGSIVVIRFTEPIDTEAGNIVNGVVSMDIGTLLDGGVAVEE